MAEPRPVQRRSAGRCVASAAGLVTALLLTACRTVPPPQIEAPALAAAPAPSPPSVVPTAIPSLADEERRLAALFRGTPVGFAMQRDGSLRVDVPLRYCFDVGLFTVKPPLAAVLEHLALSQEDGNSHIAVSAPGDAPRRGKSRRAATSARERLGNQRAVSMRDYLANKGIADSRVTISIPASGGATRAGVTVVVTDGPSP